MREILIKKEGEVVGRAIVTKTKLDLQLDEGHEVVEKVLKPKEAIKAFKKTKKYLDSDEFISFAFRALWWRRSEYAFEIV